tara:strand:+ start:981 stop:1880 length:900 start_codon:yes stop_codon:yes gene_type:complete
MADSPITQLEALIDDFHSQERIRVWSLVITIFGDAVIPRGGELWLGSLQALMDRLRIEPSAVRAAMSRLTADGWLTRLRVGRKSFYRLAETGEAEFAEGARKIYDSRRSSWSGDWTIIVLSAEAGESREARREELRAAGFGALGPNMFIRPDNPDNKVVPAVLPGEFHFFSQLNEQSMPRALVAQAWQLSDVEKHYADFARAFKPLSVALSTGAELDPLSAMAARSLMIHQFRRIALRDPLFPAELTPVDWKGDKARVLASLIYRRLAVSSERWLDGCRDSEGRAFSKAASNIANRFGV